MISWIELHPASTLVPSTMLLRTLLEKTIYVIKHNKMEIYCKYEILFYFPAQKNNDNIDSRRKGEDERP